MRRYPPIVVASPVNLQNTSYTAGSGILRLRGDSVTLQEGGELSAEVLASHISEEMSMMMRGHDNLSVNDQMEDLRERMRLLQGDRKVRKRPDKYSSIQLSRISFLWQATSTM